MAKSSASEAPWAWVPFWNQRNYHFPAPQIDQFCHSSATAEAEPSSVETKTRGSLMKASPWLYQLWSRLSLLERGVANASNRRLVVANHTRLVGEKAALPGGATVRRVGIQRVGVDDCAHRRAGNVGEFVTALHRGGHTQNVIQNARARAVAGSRAQQSKRVGITEVRALRGERHQTGVDRVQRTNGRRFVGRHLRLQQVRNCDGRDDQNDRHDDQQLDKRETLLLLHESSLREFWCPARERSRTMDAKRYGTARYEATDSPISGLWPIFPRKTLTHF